MEEAPAEGRHQVTHDAHRPRADPQQRDVVRVATEDGDVVPDPGEGEVLVVEAEVTRSLVCLQGEPAEGAQPVVEGNHDQVPLQQDLGTVHHRLAGPHQEGTAGYEDQHGGQLALDISQDTITLF